MGTTLVNLASKIDGMQIAREQHRIANTPTPQRPPVIRHREPVTDVEEARRIMLELQDRRNPHEILAELHEEQLRLSELIDDLSAILANNPTEQEKRDILGYQQKVLPSLAGIADTFVQVPGTLERTREKLQQIETDLPRLERMIADYDSLRESVKGWTWARINQIRNAENERHLISKGRAVQKRGRPSMAGYTLDPV